MTPDMLQAATRLADALHGENEALARLDLASAGALLLEKTDAAARFAAAARLAQDAPLVDAATTVRAARRLRELADENRALLDRAIQIQGRVIGTIRQAALRPGANRRYSAGGKPEASRPTPVALSNSI